MKLICHGNTLLPSLQIRYEVAVVVVVVSFAIVPISSSFFRSLSLMDEGAEERGRRRHRHRHYGVTATVAEIGEWVTNLIIVLAPSDSCLAHVRIS